jgi:deoxycytidylate deaminase
MGMAKIQTANSQSNRGCIITDGNNQFLSMADETPPIHPEIKAILNCKQPITYGIAYITHSPCQYCILALIYANIKKMIYIKTDDINQDSLDFITKSNCHIEQFNGNLNWIRDYCQQQKFF